MRVYLHVLSFCLHRFYILHLLVFLHFFSFSFLPFPRLSGAFYYTAPFSDLHLYHSSFTNNTVIGQHGGAFYGDTAGNSIIVKETVFEGNSAQLPETGNGGKHLYF